MPNPLENISLSELKSAAKAWRYNDCMAHIHWTNSGWFRWLMPEPSLSVHDRIDDLVAEIERLRLSR